MFIWKGALKTPQQNTPRIPMQILTPFLHWSKKSLNLSWYVFNEEEPWKPLNKILLVFPCRFPPPHPLSPLIYKIAQPCLVWGGGLESLEAPQENSLVFPCWFPPPSIGPKKNAQPFIVSPNVRRLVIKKPNDENLTVFLGTAMQVDASLTNSDRLFS